MPATITSFSAETWFELREQDVRGYLWRPPGTYVVALADDGHQLAEVRVNYCDRDGSDITDELLTRIGNALSEIYSDDA